MSDPALPHVQLYTDGACSGNPGPGGWAYLLRDIGSAQEVECSGSNPATTNNQMEMQSVIEGLHRLDRPTRVDLYSDSQYVIKGISEWMEGWKQRGWRRANKGKVANLDLWKELDVLNATHDLTCHWVKGHDDHLENERCDALAVAARDAASARLEGL